MERMHRLDFVPLCGAAQGLRRDAQVSGSFRQVHPAICSLSLGQQVERQGQNQLRLRGGTAQAVWSVSSAERLPDSGGQCRDAAERLIHQAVWDQPAGAEEDSR